MASKKAKYFTGGPKPSTPRGKRRHERRSDSEKKHAEAVWAAYTGGRSQTSN